MPSPSPVGRDSIRVRLMPRTANSVSSSSSAPGWSSRDEGDQRGPVRAGGRRRPGRAAHHHEPGHRVRRVVHLGGQHGQAVRGSAANGAGQRGVDSARRRPGVRRLGVRRRRHATPRRAGGRRASARHCGCGCGWPPTVLMSASPVPGRPSSANVTGSSSSRGSCSGSPAASSSRVAVTAPSTEFSIGTTRAPPAPPAPRRAPPGRWRWAASTPAPTGNRPQRGLGEGPLRPEVGVPRGWHSRHGRDPSAANAVRAHCVLWSEKPADPRSPSWTLAPCSCCRPCC